ncbi:hypothetical protein [Pseudomonas sp. P5_A2_2]
MLHAYMRCLIFVGLAAFLPLVYYLAVVGGFLPYGGILLITIRNLSDSSLLLFGLGHLVAYGLMLNWLAQLIARVIARFASAHAWLATTVVLLLLAGIGAMPIFGVAHGHIHWKSAYELYGSDTLR